MHQSKIYYVNTGTHLFKDNEPPMAFSVQILDKKWLCGAEKGFTGAQAQQSVQHNATDNRVSMCHDPQPYWVTNTCAKYCQFDLNLLLQPMFLIRIFRKNNKGILYRCLFHAHDVLRGDVRNTGKNTYLYSCNDAYELYNVWILEMRKPFGERHSWRHIKHWTPLNSSDLLTCGEIWNLISITRKYLVKNPVSGHRGIEKLLWNKVGHEFKLNLLFYGQSPHR